MKKIIIITVVLLISIFNISTYAASDTEIEQIVRAVGIMNGDEEGNLNLSSNLTRAEFTKMLICASQYKDSISEQTMYSPFSDVSYDNWCASYVSLAVEKSWINGYIDGTFKPNNNIKLEEAVNIVLKVLGYTNEDFIGAYPYAQLNLYKSLNLDENISTKQGEYILRKDAMHLFYNMLNTKTKQGQQYLLSLGYSTDSNGNIDINKVINSSLKGPYVYLTSLEDLGIEEKNIEVIRNNKVSTVDEIMKYDVIYYCKNLKKIWAYSNVITGTYESANSTSSPTTINISGNSYSIETSKASYYLSDNGIYHVGDVITVLLGRSGIVSVMSSEEYTNINYGIVSNISTDIYLDSNNNEYSARTITITSTDGNTYKIKNNSKSLEIGDVVKINYSGSQSSISKLGKKSITGKITNNTIGEYDIASNIKIIDVNHTNIAKVYMSDILGSTLSSDDVLYYAKNENNEITDLILNNYTGKLYTYGIITNISKNEMGNNINVSYTYQVLNKNTTVNTDFLFNVKEEPVRINIVNNTVKNMKALTKFTNIKEISTVKVENSSQSMKISSDVQVYIKEEGQYYVSNINEIVNNQDEYLINAYYDSNSNNKSIKIIIAM